MTAWCAARWTPAARAPASTASATARPPISSSSTALPACASCVPSSTRSTPTTSSTRARSRPRPGSRTTSAGRYDRPVQRAIHDRGGWPTDAAIDRSEHELADWELRTDALLGALARHDLMNVDQLRRGIESMPPEDYERASYYERWLFSIEARLAEAGVLAPGELDARLAR